MEYWQYGSLLLVGNDPCDFGKDPKVSPCRTHVLPSSPCRNVYNEQIQKL